MVSVNSILAASLLSIATADFGGSVNAVVSDASALLNVVNGWTANDGLIGALGIQQSYDPLSSAVSNLHDASNGISQQDIANNIGGINNLAGGVAQLLNALSSKANDLNSVGAASIVTADIDGLSGSAAAVISKLLSVNSDAGLLNSVKANVNSLADAFTTAISAFSASQVSFPHV